MATYEGLTRRQFVRAGAIVGVGLATGATTACSSKDAEKPETPTWRFGERGAMGERVLVGYATKTGSTAGVAQRIGEVLGERGFEVDVRPMIETKSLDDYDRVVLGSAVNGGTWLPEAVEFVESQAKTLKVVPVAAFCVHIMNAGDGEKETAKRLAYLDKVRSVVRPVDEGFFLGKGPDEDANFVMKWAFRAFGGAGEGDCRDWDEITGWAQGVSLG